MTGARIGILVCRLLLLAYPAAFRRRFGRAMEQSVIDRYTDARRRGLASGAAFLAKAFADLALNLVVLRACAVRDRLLWPDPISVHHQFGRRDMWWQVLLADATFAWRMFVRNPVFSALAVVALALGIGANTAIFTLVDGVLLRPLPYSQPDRLVMVWSTNEREHRDRDTVSPLDFLDLRKASAFSSVQASYSFLVAATLTGPSGAEQVVVTAVTPGMFEMLGRAPVIGRSFSDAELDTAVVVSYNFWRTRLGADPAVLGRTLTINAQPRTIVGVMPRDFVFPYRAMLGPSGFTRAQEVEAWLPLALIPQNTRQTGTAPLARGVRLLTVVGRLNTGVTVDQARAEVEGVARQLADTHPDTNKGVGATVVPAHDQAVGSTRSALLLLLAGVGLVLLMACVNLANMLLARGTTRQKEFAIRVALGAGRARLVQQTLVESVLLALTGGAVALLVLVSAIRGVVGLAPPEIPRLAEVRPDLTVVLFAVALSVATGILIGVVPAVSASRVDVNTGLKESARGATSRGFQRGMRAALVVAEAALAVVLTIGAGLLLRSFVSLVSVDPGFRTDRLLTLQITVPPKYASAEQRRVLYADLEARLGSIPGVTAVGGTTRLPLGSTNVSTKILIEGRALAPSQWPEAEFRRAIFSYFAAMDIPVLRGRGFAPTDGPDAPPVCVINESMARQMFAGEDPIGKRVKFGTPDGAWSTIVGVIGDVRHSALDARPAPEVYIYYLQGPPVNPFLVVRTTRDPLSIVGAVRAQLLAADTTIASNDIRPMTAVLADSVSERRFVLLLATAFGLLALVMAAVGVYGVMSLIVSERAPEMAIRLALGAEPSRVLAVVMRQGLSLTAAGAAIGTAISAAIAPSIRAELFGVQPGDPVTFVAVPALVLVIAAVACVVPARRTMRIDPVSALKAE